MEVKLDESSVNILQNIFDWTDFDGDGKISNEDIFKSLGLPSKEDAERLFSSLKDLAGSEKSSEFLTFEDFCKGIMDYPSLIHQFYHDFHVEPSKNCQSSESSERSSIKSEIDFLPTKLKIAITFYNNTLKQSIPELDSTSTEELLEALRTCLEGLKHKSKTKALSTVEILNGSIELYLLVRELTRLNEKLISEKNFEISELQSQLVTLNQKYDRVLEENDKLIVCINNLEKTQEKINRVQLFTFEENKKLESELAKAEEKETDFKTYIEEIRSVIIEKEKEMTRMEKQVRHLNALKAIQELKVSTAHQTKEMRAQRISQIRQQKSVQFNYGNSFELCKGNSLNNDLKFYSSQIMNNNNFSVKLSQIEVSKVKKLENEIFALKEENEVLIEKIQRISQYDHTKPDFQELNSMPSLYDEFLMAKEGSESEFRGSVIYHSETRASLRDSDCQTEDSLQLIIPESQDRECCSLF